MAFSMVVYPPNGFIAVSPPGIDVQDANVLNLFTTITLPRTLFPYLLIGSLAATVDWLFFYLFAVYAGLSYLWVSATGFVLATFVNYALCVKVVFRFRRKSAPAVELFLIYLVSGAGLLLHQSLLYYAISVRGIDMMLAKISATGLVFFWNYGMRRFVIFPHRSRA